jgi:hypothetical protein
LTADFTDQIFPEQCSPNEMLLKILRTSCPSKVVQAKPANREIPGGHGTIEKCIEDQDKLRSPSPEKSSNQRYRHLVGPVQIRGRDERLPLGRPRTQALEHQKQTEIVQQKPHTRVRNLCWPSAHQSHHCPGLESDTLFCRQVSVQNSQIMSADITVWRCDMAQPRFESHLKIMAPPFTESFFTPQIRNTNPSSSTFSSHDETCRLPISSHYLFSIRADCHPQQ